MKKKVDFAFGKKIYLLGTDKYGRRRWLEAPSWDCGWYWGFGYIESYTNNLCPSKSRDIACHTHFCSLFLNYPQCNGLDTFKEFFSETVLTDEEIWKLLELMKTFYILCESSGLFHRGGAHYTTNSCYNVIKNDEIYNKINREMMPALFKEIEKLLSPEE